MSTFPKDWDEWTETRDAIGKMHGALSGQKRIVRDMPNSTPDQQAARKAFRNAIRSERIRLEKMMRDHGRVGFKIVTAAIKEEAATDGILALVQDAKTEAQAVEEATERLTDLTERVDKVAEVAQKVIKLLNRF